MRTPIIILLLATGSPMALRADSVRSFQNYCTVGALRTCASVSLSVVKVGTTTTLRISVQNIQGLNPADNSGGSLLSGLTLRFRNAPPDPGFDNDAVTKSLDPGNAGAIGSANRWDTFAENNSILILMTSVGSGITGCDPVPIPMNFPNLGDLVGAYQTCPAKGIPGPVVFSFSTDQATGWEDLSNVDLFWGFDWTEANGQNGVGCVVDVNCTQTNVVPEPTTMILLGSGLAGLAAFQRRRRSSENRPGNRDGHC